MTFALVVLVLIAVWVLSLYAAPFGACPRCHGKRRITTGRRRPRPVPCSRCNGVGRCQRPRSRTVHQLPAGSVATATTQAALHPHHQHTKGVTVVMPTSHCRGPEHYHQGPSTTLVLGWIVALDPLIITHLHAVEVILIAVSILTARGVPVLLLLHNHRRFYDRELEYHSAALRVLQPHTNSQSRHEGSNPAVAAADHADALSAAPRRPPALAPARRERRRYGRCGPEGC